MSLEWGVPLMLAKIDQIETFLVKSLVRKVSAFKTHPTFWIFLKCQQPFSRGIDYKKTSAVYSTTNWYFFGRKKKLFDHYLKTIEMQSDGVSSFPPVYFLDEPRMRSFFDVGKNRSNRNVFCQEFGKENFCFQNPLFESFWNASIPSAGAMTTKWQARCIALQNEQTRKVLLWPEKKPISSVFEDHWDTVRWCL